MNFSAGATDITWGENTIEMESFFIDKGRQITIFACPCLKSRLNFLSPLGGLKLIQTILEFSVWTDTSFM